MCRSWQVRRSATWTPTGWAGNQRASPDSWPTTASFGSLNLQPPTPTSTPKRHPHPAAPHDAHALKLAEPRLEVGHGQRLGRLGVVPAAPAGVGARQAVGQVAESVQGRQRDDVEPSSVCGEGQGWVAVAGMTVVWCAYQHMPPAANLLLLLRPEVEHPRASEPNRCSPHPAGCISRGCRTWDPLLGLLAHGSNAQGTAHLEEGLHSLGLDSPRADLPGAGRRGCRSVGSAGAATTRCAAIAHKAQPPAAGVCGPKHILPAPSWQPTAGCTPGCSSPGPCWPA